MRNKKHFVLRSFERNYEKYMAGLIDRSIEMHSINRVGYSSNPIHQM